MQVKLCAIDEARKRNINTLFQSVRRWATVLTGWLTGWQGGWMDVWCQPVDEAE